MYPSFNNEDTDLFTFSENIYTNPTSTNHENLSSSSPLFNYFPLSPLTNYSEEALFFQQFNEILHKKIDDQDHEASDINMIKFSDDKCSSNVNEVIKLSSENHDEEIQKKGRCKKDKHSKILTANGSSRGRRMRLSIDVAKEFFRLQDILGFDKASKTVEWLLEKSKNDIKELTKHNSSPFCLSAVDEIEPEVTTKEKTKEGKGVRKLAVSHSLARELREKARARARERTSEKKRLQPIGGCTQQMNMGSCNPFLSGDESDAAGIKFHKIYTSNYPASLLVEELPQKSGDSCFITNTWNNSSTILNHQYNSRVTSIENQSPAFQYDGKPWEGFL